MHLSYSEDSRHEALYIVSEVQIQALDLVQQITRLNCLSFYVLKRDILRKCIKILRIWTYNF